MQVIPGVSCFMLENYCTAATILPGNDAPLGNAQTATPQNPRYPLTNLLLEQRSERWRSPETAPSGVSYISIHFDMGKPVKPNTFALVDCPSYITSTQLIGSTAPDFVSDPAYVYVDFKAGGNFSAGAVVTQPQSRVMMWHNDDTDTTGMPFSAKRYWRMYFPWVDPVYTQHKYVECGVVWLGRRFEMPIDTKFRIAGENNSNVSSLDSGAKYFDRRPRSRAINCSTVSKEMKDVQDFRNAIERAAPGSPILCDVYSFGAVGGSINPTTACPAFVSEGRFYGYLDGKTGWDQRTVKVGRFSFSIEEAVA